MTDKDKEVPDATAKLLDAHPDATASDTETKGQTDYEAAEAAAPRAVSGPLPVRVETLRYIPSQYWERYERDLDGSFRLAWVSAEDANYGDFVESIAAGRVKVIGKGESVASMLEHEKIQAEMKKIFQAELAKGEARERAERIARQKAREDKELADLKRRQEMHRLGMSV